MFVLTRALFGNNEIDKPVLLNYRAQNVFGKNEQSIQTSWCGAQCSCIGCIGLRPALRVPLVGPLLSPRTTLFQENSI